MIYGYARVSTDGQSVDAQVKALRAAGAEKMFKETASGAKPDRARLRQALKEIDEGDVLMVTRLDRLARSTRDLLNIYPDSWVRRKNGLPGGGLWIRL
jgi:DNA invertase Pin-like site-specific DNA recombinase